MSSTEDRVPAHLRRFVVQQDPAAYSAVDQAVWRFVLLQLYDRLQATAHPAYARGLSQAGMTTERIPRIAEMDTCLSDFGWGAVCVDGFIPPRAFQEFQALGILPIAADIRTLEHLPYTPAPDIIHEAAGHAPILPDVEYGAFLRRIGECGVRAFGSSHDRDTYEAIRNLSIIKEQRDAAAQDIAHAERTLALLVAHADVASEAAQLARLYWWTVEYGLVGTPSDYRIYGAGLLSSLAESHFCSEPAVRKLVLSADCAAVDYDITRPQPQLFVARDFAHLGDVLDEVCAGFAFRKGGLTGLRTAQDAAEVATIEFESGLQATGVLGDVIDEGGQLRLLSLRGECALAEDARILRGHERDAYPGGVLFALGAANARACSAVGTRDAHLRIDLAAGMRVEGVMQGEPTVVRADWREFVLHAASVWRGEERIAAPSRLCLLVSADERVRCVRAGASDAGYWPKAAYPTQTAPARCAESAGQRELRLLYERAPSATAHEVAALHTALQREHPDEWLLRWNLLERLRALDLDPARRQQLEAELWSLEQQLGGRHPIAMGLRYLARANMR